MWKPILLLIGVFLILVAPAASQPVTAPGSVERTLYAVNQSAGARGSISVYAIDAGHRLIGSIKTVPNVEDVKGVVASAETGQLFVAYRSRSGDGRIFCLNLYNNHILWDRHIKPGVDRLAIDPTGRLLYVPTWEGNSADFINVIDAKTGHVVRHIHISNHSHDAQYPLSGPLFQETKAEDGSGAYIYKIDPVSYAVARIGPFAGIVGPYAVDRNSHYVVANVSHLLGLQVADLKSGAVITARVSHRGSEDPGLLHGIGWTPDEREVWESGMHGDVYVWDMRDPMTPVFKRSIKLQIADSPHWLNFSIKSDFAYVSPAKNSDDAVEVFSVANRTLSATIGSSEDLLEIDYRNGKIVEAGNQFGIGRFGRFAPEDQPIRMK